MLQHKVCIKEEEKQPLTINWLIYPRAAGRTCTQVQCVDAACVRQGDTSQPEVHTRATITGQTD